MPHPVDRDDHNVRRRAPWHCLLCRSEEIAVESIPPEFVMDCRTCGAKLAYLPHPPDAPQLAGRIEVLVEPFAARADAVPAESRDMARPPIGRAVV
jgi:hypothetical protein